MRFIPAKYAGRQVALALLEADPDTDADLKELVLHTIQAQKVPLEGIKGPGVAGTYQTFKDRLLKGRTRRKLENNTYVEYIELVPDSSIGIRLHSTHVVTAHPDDRVEINFGGWETVTTIDRMNRYLPTGWGIHRKKNVTCWSIAGFGASDPMVEIRIPASSGDVIMPDGTLKAQEPPIYKRLRKPAHIHGQYVPSTRRLIGP